MSDYNTDDLIIPEYTQEQVDDALGELMDALLTCDGVKRKGEGFLTLSVDTEIFHDSSDISLARALAKYLHRMFCFEIKQGNDELEGRLHLQAFRKNTPKGYWQDANYLIEKQKHGQANA